MVVINEGGGCGGSDSGSGRGGGAEETKDGGRIEKGCTPKKNKK